MAEAKSQVVSEDIGEDAERKRAEEALREAERKYHYILESSGQGIFQTTPDGRFIVANSALARMFGFESADELINTRTDISSQHYVEPQKREEFKRLFEENGFVQKFEYQAYQKDGSRIWISENVRAVRDDSGTVVYYEGTARDITERKQAEERLRESEERYRDLVENSRELICTHDLDGQILSVNRAAASVLGYDQSDYSGKKNLRDILAPEFRDEFDDYLRTIRNDGVASGLMLVQTAAGERRIWEYYNTLRTEGLPKPIVRGMAHDVTDRKRAEEALRELGRKYRDIFENAGEGIFQSTPNGQFIAANPALARMHGFASPEEFIQSRNDIPRQIYADPARREEFKLLLEEQGVVRGFEHQIFRKDGSKIWISVNARAVRDEQGGVWYYEGTAQDITERKHAEDQLRESEERYRELFENAKETIYVHDLDGRYTSVNRAAEKLSGYTREEILGKTFLDFIAPEYVEDVREHLCQKLVTHGETSYETEFIARNGRHVPVEVSSRLIYENGVPIAVQGMAQDITERKQAEDELSRQTEILQKIVDCIPVMINFTGADGRVKLVNEEWQRKLGWSLEEILTEEIDVFAECYPDPAYRHEVLNFTASANGDWLDFKTRVRDGAVIDTSWANINLSDGTTIGIGQDVTERKRAEEALRNAEQKFRNIFEHAVEGIFQTTPDGRFIAANPALARMFGFSSPEEMIRERADISKQQYVEPERRKEFKRLLEAQGVVHDFEYEGYRRDGSRIWASDSVRVVCDPDGTALYYEGFTEDITERKRSEKALRESEERFSKAFHSSPAALSIALLADGRLLEVNAAFLRMTGYTRDEIIGRTALEVGLWASPDCRLTMAETLREGAPVDDLEISYRRKSGELRDGLLSVDLIELQGEPCILGISQDITERKQAEEELKMREAQLTDAQRLAHLGSWEWDLATNIVTWSDELFRIWGVNPQEFGASYEAVLQLVHPDDRKSFATLIEKAVQEHQPYSFEHRIIRPDATRRIIHARGAVVVDEAGRAIRLFGTSQDITERKLAEDEIKATNDLLRALSAKLQSAREEEGARIARELHDELGSALTSLNWGLEEVDRRLTSGDHVDVSALREKIETMTTLVDTTIDTVRRISSELRPSVLDDLGLVEAIEWQAQQFQAQTGIIYQSDCSVEDIDLSREQSTAVFRIFQEALTNILRHAEATRFASTLKLESNNLVLTISDNGKGITANEVSRPQSLGLLGMRERAHLVGGEINITGAEGQGTVITVRVPLVAKRTTTVSAAARS
ncbi:MAG TPA: PAS domain S-box protein [Pyrinomonadaceae bacterium]|jgi:PAS domain S-box-containing protein